MIAQKALASQYDSLSLCEDHLQFDQVTGFYNKLGFERAFKKIFQNRSPEEPLVAVGIKARNISDIQLNYGYQVSEAYLKRLSGKVKILLRFSKILAFIPPDIFVSVISCKNEEEINGLASRLCSSLQGPFLFKGSFFPIKVAVSVCTISSNCHPTMLLNVMIRLSEKAAYQNRLIFAEYEKEKKYIENNLPIYLSISKKIAMGDLGFALQPIYSTSSSKIAFYEVLARLVAKKQVLSPDSFMEKVEQLKLKQDLERAILYKVFVYLQENRDIERVSVNISLDYIAERLELDLYQYLREVSINPERICFEVTEQPSSSNIDRRLIRENLFKLKKKGFKIALDDFGLYHSNFGLLKEFPWDIVKIDGSFVRTILESKFDYSLVEFLVKISKMKGFKIVAEYVENEKLANELKKLGIHYLQGYLFGQPKFVEESLSILPPLLYSFCCLIKD